MATTSGGSFSRLSLRYPHHENENTKSAAATITTASFIPRPIRLRNSRMIESVATPAFGLDYFAAL
jgi:hypothetical protein